MALSESALHRIWTILFITTISGARIGMGIFTSLSGPTLLYLAGNVDSSVAKISTVFTGRSIGILLGSILGGIVKNIVGPNFRHLYTLGSGIEILGLMDLAVPWITEFWVLILDITVGGIMFGYLDAGLQALILQLWGELSSRTQIQLFHFMYSVGALIAPFIAAPFLAKADEENPADESCPNIEPSPTSSTPSMFNMSTTEGHLPSEFNPVGWTYIIAAVWMVFVAFLLVIFAAFNIEQRVSKGIQKKGLSSENRPEEPLRQVIWIFLPVIGYYFCSVSTENVFFNYIYSVSLCSDLDFTVTQASHITSVFWIGFGLGRLCGVFASVYFKPRTIIIISIIGSIVDSMLMCIFGEHTPWLAWLVSGLHGLTTALLYPSGVSWVSQNTNISGTYMFICNIGNALGSLTMLPLGGYLFDLNPFSVMYLVFALALLNAGFYSLALLAGKRHKQFLLLNDELKENNGVEDYGSTNCEFKIEDANVEITKM